MDVQKGGPQGLLEGVAGDPGWRELWKMRAALICVCSWGEVSL